MERPRPSLYFALLMRRSTRATLSAVLMGTSRRPWTRESGFWVMRTDWPKSGAARSNNSASRFTRRLTRDRRAVFHSAALDPFRTAPRAVRRPARRSRRRARTAAPSPRAAPRRPRGCNAPAAAPPSTAARSRRRRGTRSPGTHPTSARTARHRRPEPCRRVWPPWEGRAVRSADSFREDLLQIKPLLPRRHRLPQIPDLPHALANVVDAEVLDANPLLDLLPRHWRRHAGERRRADGVDRRQRASPGVLVVIDEDAGVGALHLAVLGGDDVAVARLQLEGDRLRERPHLFLQRAAHDGNVDVHPLRSGRLRVRLHAELAEDVAHVQGHAADHVERRAGAGVEIEVEKVGAVGVVAARVPRV